MINLFKMGCGAYHSVITIGETRFNFKKFTLEVIKKTIKKLIPGEDLDIMKVKNENNQSGATNHTQAMNKSVNSKLGTPMSHKISPGKSR